jgi:hypothetical protein
MGTKYGIVELYGGKNMRYWVQCSDDLDALRATAELLASETDKVYAIAAVTGETPQYFEYVYVGGHEFENTGKGKAVAAPDGAVTFDDDAVPVGIQDDSEWKTSK